MDSVINELAAVKSELNEYKKLTSNYESKIEALETENKYWQSKVEKLELHDRVNKLVLSGPAIKLNNNYLPAQLRDESIKNVKEVYNFDLRKEDVNKCE